MFKLRDFLKVFLTSIRASEIPKTNEGQYPIADFLLSQRNFNAIEQNGIIRTVNAAMLRNPAIAFREGKEIQVVFTPKYSAAERANQIAAENNTVEWCPSNGKVQDKKNTKGFTLRYDHISPVYGFDDCYERGSTGANPNGIAAYDRNSAAFRDHYNRRLTDHINAMRVKMQSLITNGYAHDGRPYIGGVPCSKDNSCVKIPILTADGGKISNIGRIKLRNLKADLGLPLNTNFDVFGNSFSNAVFLDGVTTGPDANGIYRGGGLGINFMQDNTISKNGGCDLAVLAGSFMPIVMPYSGATGTTKDTFRMIDIDPVTGILVFVIFGETDCVEYPTPTFQFLNWFDIISEHSCGTTTDSRLQNVTGAFYLEAICQNEDNCKALTPCQTANIVALPTQMTSDCVVDVLPACADICNVFATHSFVAATKYCVNLTQFTTVASITVNGDTTVLSTAYDTTNPVQMLLLGAELQGILGSNTVVIESGPAALCVVKKGTPYVQFFLTSTDGNDFDTNNAVPVSLFSLTTTGSAPTAYTLDITVGGNNFPAATPDTIATGLVLGSYGTYGQLYITVPDGTVNTGDPIVVALHSDTCGASYSSTVGNLVPIPSAAKKPKK